MSIKYTSNITISNNNEDASKRPLTRNELVDEYNSRSASRARYARIKAEESSLIHKQNIARAKERRAQRAAYDAMRKEEEAKRAEKRALERELAAAQARAEAGENEHRNRTSTRKSRVVPPLSSKEYQEKTRRNFEHYERERAARDPYLGNNKKGGERTVIDGRGTIDSRAFHEHDIITNFTIDDRDKHEAALTVNDSPLRWKSKSARFDENTENSNSIFSSMPRFVLISIPIIVILIAIIIFLLIKH